jgi:hypothetical protein
MSDVVNLNRARKAQLKVAAKATAAQNRVKFGRSKSAKTVDDAARRKARTSLDQARREPE